MKRTRDAFFHSLAFKIGVVIILAEMVISFVSGAFYITNFNAAIDRRIADNVLRPAALMNQGLLKLDVVTDEKRMSELVGEELIDAFVIGLNGNIFYSLNHEYTGRSAGSAPRIEAALLDPGLTRPLVRAKGPQGHLFALAPLFGVDGRSVRFFVYIEASTAVAADQKRDNVWLFVLGALAMVVLTSLVILIAFHLTIFTPLQHILNALGQVESGDLTIQLAPADSRDELGDLAQAFNRMTAHQRQTLEALHRERDLLERITETSPVGIAVVDHDGQVTFANAQSEKVLGLSKDTITQRTYNAPVWRITDDDGAPFPDEELPFRQVMTTRRPAYDVQHAIVWPDGHRVLLSINAAPLLDGAGEVAHVVCTIEDITQRRQAEEKLKESEERLRMTLEATQIGIFDWDVEHDFWYASPEYYTMLGYEPVYGRGDRQEWLGRVHPDDRVHVEAKIREVLDNALAADQSQPYEYEARMRHADGCYRWEHVRGFGVRRNQQGRVTRLLGVRMDITDRKKAEEALRRLNLELDQRVLDRTAQLEAANKELEAFAYSVSHDLRAPLRHIDGFLVLLEKSLETALGEQSRQYMKTISAAAQKMGELIDDLLSFSRMGRNAISIRALELEPLVRDVIAELEPDAGGRTIDWRIGDLPVVRGDGAMLRNVLVNLISNALKFTQPREQVRIEIGSQAGRNYDTVIFVRDNGVGFDMAYADKLFGVFQRLHRAEEFEGTGIGLANVRRIITRHGGRVWAEAEVEQGATFYFTLPQA